MSKIVNGVNLSSIEQLFKAINQHDALANLRFEAKSEWKGGTVTEVTVSPYYAGGQNLAPSGRKFRILVDEPLQFGGTDSAPNPVEYLAAALCGCLTAGIATNAGFSNARVDALEIEVQADMNIRGLLGMDDTPTACNRIDYKIKLKGADGEALLKSKNYFDEKSAVASTLKSPVPMTTAVEIETP